MLNNIHLYSWFWWRNRFSILIMLGSVLISQAVFWIGGEKSDAALPSLLLSFAIAGTCFSALTVFSFGSNLDLTSGRSSFPNWLFNLPMTSTRLALIPILAMVFAFAWGWIPAANAFNHMNSHTASPEMMPSNYNILLLPWFGLSAFGLWLQAIAWWPFSRAWTRMCCLGTLAFSLALLVTLGQVFVLGPWYPTLATLGPAVAGFGAAMWSATRARHMTWRSEAEPDTFLNVGNSDQGSMKLSDLIKRPFRSPVTAIAWRDWKQLGRAPLILMLMICIPMALMVATLPTSFRSIAFLFFVPAMLLVFVSPMLGKSRYWKDNYELTTFLAGLPVSDDQFVKSRFATTIKTACVLWSCVFVVALIWILSEANRTELSGMVTVFAEIEGVQNGWSAIAAWLCVTFYLAAVAPWSGLALGLFGRKWLKRTVVLVCSIGGLAFFIYLSTRTDGLMARLGHPETRVAAVESLSNGFRTWLIVALIFKVIVDVALVVYAYRPQAALNSYAMPLRLVEIRPLMIWGSALAGLCLLATVFFCWMLVPFGFESWVIVLAVVLTFPCGAFVASKIALDFNRHR